MRSTATYSNLCEQLRQSATFVGLDVVPMRRRRKGLYSTLRRLSKQLKPGLAIRLIIPKELSPTSIRAAWARICESDSHVVIEDNNNSTYVAYLWVENIEGAKHKEGK